MKKAAHVRNIHGSFIVAAPALSMIYFIAVIVAAYLGSIAGARAEPEPDRVCFSMAEMCEKVHAHGLVEPFRVMRSAASRPQAEAFGVKLCRWSEELVCEMSPLRRDGPAIQVIVNARPDWSLVRRLKMYLHDAMIHRNTQVVAA